jgi:glycosyltransferase involved in cell wall biosynthesis
MSVLPQVKELGPDVELVISDNCSIDNTRQLVERFRQHCPIRYHRQEKNIGVVRNVLSVVGTIAAGTFCWVIGDDDMLRPGALRKLIGVIEKYPDLDYFYVNYSIDEYSRRAGRVVDPAEFLTWNRTGNENLDERVVPDWTTLLGEDFSCLTPIYASVFRRAVWLRGAETLRLATEVSETSSFPTIDESFPHSVIFARTMIGKRAWASGYPWVICCGIESWLDYVPLLVLLRFHELFDEYARLGADPHLWRRQRQRMFEYATSFFTQIFRGVQLPGLANFSIPRFMKMHWRQRDAWRSLYQATVTVSISNIVRHSLLVATFAVGAKIWFRVRNKLSRFRMRLQPVHSTNPESTAD